MRPREHTYRRVLSRDAVMVVEFRVVATEVVRYSVLLLVRHNGVLRPVRLFDNAHGDHDMHRYIGSEKQSAEPAHPGSAGEAMRDATARIEDGYEEMIESWLRLMA